MQYLALTFVMVSGLVISSAAFAEDPENTSPPPSWGSNSNNYGMEALPIEPDQTNTNYSFDWQSTRTTALTPASYSADEIKKVENVPDNKKMRQASLEDYNQESTTNAMKVVSSYTGKKTGIGEPLGVNSLTQMQVTSDKEFVDQLASTTAADQIKKTPLIGNVKYQDTSAEAVKIIQKFNFKK